MQDDIYSPTVDPTVISGEPDEPVKTPMGKLSGGLIDFIQTLVVFGAIFAIIYLFIAQPHKVSGSSMFPNFKNADYILTDKISYRFTKPKDGEIIVLKSPQDESVDFIKRIMATPGETIRVEGNSVYRNNILLPETYLPSGTPTRSGAFIHEGQSYTLEPGHFLVFGDNREHSSDSREWGTITTAEIVGRVIFRYWPLNSFGIIRTCCPIGS